MASNIINPINITSKMSIHEKIVNTIEALHLDEYWEQVNDLCFVFRIKKAGLSYIHIGGTSDLRKTMREIYNGFQADFVNILRLVHVKLANENWERSDWVSELYSVLDEFQLAGKPFGFYNILCENDILEHFDYKLSIENFNNKFIYKNINNLQYVDEPIEPYIFNCVGDDCPNMTNGSQYCRKFFCETEESNMNDPFPPAKKQRY